MSADAADLNAVMAGPSPSKTGVNAVMSLPSTSLILLKKKDVEARDKRGHDE
jgi:hypothetical protein